MDGSGGTERLTESEYYTLLAPERRRIVLDILADRSAPVRLRNLAEAVAEREGGIDAINGNDVKRIITTLHHNHLPRIGDTGLIDYDPNDTLVVSCLSRSDISTSTESRPPGQ